MTESVDELSVLGQKEDLEYRKAQSSFFVVSFHRVHKAAEKLLAFATKSYTVHKPVMRGGRLFDFVLNLENDEELKQGDFNADPSSEVKEQLFINAQQLTKIYQHVQQQVVRLGYASHGDLFEAQATVLNWIEKDLNKMGKDGEKLDIKLFRANREAIFYLNQMAENADEDETIVSLDQIQK